MQILRTRQEINLGILGEVVDNPLILLSSMFLKLLMFHDLNVDLEVN